MPRILVIDDDFSVRIMLVTALKRAGYEVIDAENGYLGVAMFRAQPTDLVITDLVMPEKEGIETIMELRRFAPNARIIAISGGGVGKAEVYLEIATKMGVRHTLTKPFMIQELLDAVSDSLAN